MCGSMKKRYVSFHQLQESLRERDIFFQVLVTQVEHLTERLIQLEDIHPKARATFAQIEVTFHERPHSAVAEAGGELLNKKRNRRCRDYFLLQQWTGSPRLIYDTPHHTPLPRPQEPCGNETAEDSDERGLVLHRFKIVEVKPVVLLVKETNGSIPLPPYQLFT